MMSLQEKLTFQIQTCQLCRLLKILSLTVTRAAASATNRKSKKFNSVSKFLTRVPVHNRASNLATQL